MKELNPWWKKSTNPQKAAVAHTPLRQNQVHYFRFTELSLTPRRQRREEIESQPNPPFM